jgi:Uma2 family endonuclease
MAQPAYPWHPPERGWSEDDLLDLPDDGHRYEIIDGSLHVAPPADDDHHEMADELRAALRVARPEGWRVIREIGLRIPGGNAIPDVTVLKPGAPHGVRWHEPGDVALVVEVESPTSRRHDRFTKPGLYAEAGIDSYWRIERTDLGPVVHVYERAKAGHYELRVTVGPSYEVTVDRPFPVRLAPSTWVG